MKLYTSEIKMWGTAYVYANSAEQAKENLEKHCPFVADVHDNAWFSRSDDICLATAFTLSVDIDGLAPVEISMGAMRLAMRPSIRGEKGFWVPATRRNIERRHWDTYSVDVLLTATAFLPAPSVAEAAAAIGAMDGIAVHMENADDWFRADGMQDPDLQMVLSPMLSFIGPCPEPELYEEDHDPVERFDGLTLPAAYNLGSPEDHVRDDAVIEAAARELKQRFAGYSGWLSITDEDALEIAAVLRDFYEREDAEA